MVIGFAWVRLKRVNPKSFPTYSARESECTKVEAGLIYILLVFERNQFELVSCSKEILSPLKSSQVTDLRLSMTIIHLSIFLHSLVTSQESPLYIAYSLALLLFIAVDCSKCPSIFDTYVTPNLIIVIFLNVYSDDLFEVVRT